MPTTPVGDCYCVCHSPVSSCGSCEHCLPAIKVFADSLIQQVRKMHKEYLENHKELMYTPYSQAITDVITLLTQYKGTT